MAGENPVLLRDRGLRTHAWEAGMWRDLFGGTDPGVSNVPSPPCAAMKGQSCLQQGQCPEFLLHVDASSLGARAAGCGPGLAAGPTGWGSPVREKAHRNEGRVSYQVGSEGFVPAAVIKEQTLFKITNQPSQLSHASAGSTHDQRLVPRIRLTGLVGQAPPPAPF